MTDRETTLMHIATDLDHPDRNDFLLMENGVFVVTVSDRPAGDWFVDHYRSDTHESLKQSVVPTIWDGMDMAHELLKKATCVHEGVFSDDGPLDKTHHCDGCGQDVPNRDL